MAPESQENKFQHRCQKSIKIFFLYSFNIRFVQFEKVLYQSFYAYTITRFWQFSVDEQNWGETKPTNGIWVECQLVGHAAHFPNRLQSPNDWLALEVLMHFDGCTIWFCFIFCESNYSTIAFLCRFCFCASLRVPLVYVNAIWRHLNNC
jgi:hypothetical protein